MTPALMKQVLVELWYLDRTDLVAAGVIDADDEKTWMSFRDNPHTTATRLTADRFERLHGLILKKIPKGLLT